MTSTEDMIAVILALGTLFGLFWLAIGIGHLAWSLFT